MARGLQHTVKLPNVLASVIPFVNQGDLADENDEHFIHDHIAQVWIFTSIQNWVKHGSDIALILQAENRCGAKTVALGFVEVYKN